MLCSSGKDMKGSVRKILIHEHELNNAVEVSTIRSRADNSVVVSALGTPTSV